jgi:hypothetical protein
MKSKRDKSPIDPAAIYDTTLELCDERTSRNWHARLRRHGFKRSEASEAYFHPDHWLNQSIFGRMQAKAEGKKPAFRGPGDTWLMQDSFKARTKAAKEWLKNRE